MNREERRAVNGIIKSLQDLLIVDTVTMDIEFPDEEAAQLFKLCAELNVTPHQLVEIAVEKALGTDDTPEGQLAEEVSVDGE